MYGHLPDDGSGHSAVLFEPMSPQSFSPFDGLPGCCALARDEHFRLVWCNRAYASELGAASPDEVLGTTLRDVFPAEKAQERESLMKPALHEGRTVAYQQIWKGVRRLGLSP